MELILENFPNLLDHIDFTHELIEEQIKAYKLTFLQICDNTVEWRMKLPMMVPSFYSFVLVKKTLPTQELFWEYYKSENHSWFKENSPDKNITLAIKARAYRTYPSLVRDIHFSTLLRQTLTNSSVVYNTEIDIEKGIDVLVVCQGKFFGVNLFTDTSRSHDARSKKRFRHNGYDNVILIEIAVSPESSKKCGAFWLYSNNEAAKIKKLIENHF